MTCTAPDRRSSMSSPWSSWTASKISRLPAVRCACRSGAWPQPMESIPPMLTPEAPEAISPRSRSTTVRPRIARCQAAEAPAMPPPITTISLSITGGMATRILSRRAREVHAGTRAGGVHAPAGSGGEPAQAVRGHRAMDALQRERRHRCRVDQVLDGDVHALRDQDLPGLGLAAEASGDVRHGADGAIVPPAFEADGADGRVPLRDADAEPQLVTEPAPLLRHRAHLGSHRQRHPHR